MKQFLFSILFLGLSFLAVSQENIKEQENDTYFIKWEGVSKEGHIIYGVSYTKEEAQFVIDDFNRRNAYTKYKIVFQFLKKRTTNDEDIVSKFYEDNPDKYRVLRRLDIAALHIFQIGNFDKAVEYLVKNTNRGELDAQKYIHKLLKEYQ